MRLREANSSLCFFFHVFLTKFEYDTLSETGSKFNKVEFFKLKEQSINKISRKIDLFFFFF